MLFTTVLSAFLAVPFTPPLPHVEVDLVESRMGALALLEPDGTWSPFGPPSPRGFGAEAGRLRVLVTTDSAVIVELADPAHGALFGIPFDGGAPRRLANTGGVGLDVALSPDRRRLFYDDGGRPTVLALDGSSGPVRVAGAPAKPRDMRVESPRWLDDVHVAWELSTSPPAGPFTSMILTAPADGSAPARPLVPAATPAQDRFAGRLRDLFAAYRDGVLTLFSADRRPRALAPHFDGTFVATVGDRMVFALGPGGVTHRIGLAAVAPDGTVSEIVPSHEVYLDPIVAPGGDALLWSVRAGRGWRVERLTIAGDQSSRTPLTAIEADPIELGPAVPGSTLIAGCRGPDIVVFDTRMPGSTRILTTAPANPSCTIRGATSAGVAFERKVGEAWRSELLPIDAARKLPITPASAASIAAVSANHVVIQTSDPVARIVARSGSQETVLVPWQLGGIADAHLAPDGQTVVFHTASAPLGPEWSAVRVDRPGRVIPITNADSGVVVGLTADALVTWQAGLTQLLSWRLDGANAGAGRVILRDVLRPGPLAPELGRAIATVTDGRVVAVPVVSPTPSQPTILLSGGWFDALHYDPVRRRVVARSSSATAIVAASIFGDDVDRPIILGTPRPPENANVQRIDLADEGDVLIHYATRWTAVPHPAGTDRLAANGSGFRPVGSAASDVSPQTVTPFPDDDWSGAETRHALMRSPTPLRQ